MNYQLYLNFFNSQLQRNFSNQQDIIDSFHKTLIHTNRSFDFFVDWNKVLTNIKKYNVEFSILDSLIGCDYNNFDNELKQLLRNYTEIIPSIPTLLALRKRDLEVVRNFNATKLQIIKYDFAKRKLNQQEEDEMVELFDKTGLKKFFVDKWAKSIKDYALGIEVGMDTNARKNRSGKIMENLISPVIKGAKSKNDILISQKYFRYLSKKPYNLNIGSSLKNRKADFILVKSGNPTKYINIETNFYSGTGSKPQEIVNSYINRQKNLYRNHLYFIWITDGNGWNGQKNQINYAFNNIDYLLNIQFVRWGLLKEIIQYI